MSTPSEKNPAPAAEDGTRAPIELKYNPHEGVEEPYLILPGGAHGAAVVKDLATYISRALAVNPDAAIRLTAPVIMGMRALHLAAESTLDMTVQAQALQERLARLQKQAEQQNPEFVLYMPPVTVNAGWTGKAAPVRGWSEVGTVPVEEFARATAEGLEAVDRALPENPGAAVLTTVRSRIWSSPMVLEYLPAFDGVQVPTGAAFALRVYGFIPEGFTGELPIFAARVGSDEWLRIVAPAGMVLVRRGSGSLL